METTVAEKVCTIRGHIADRIGQQQFRTWFGDSVAFRLNSDRLDLAVESEFVGAWIESNFISTVEDATRKVLGANSRVVVQVVESEDQEPQSGGTLSAANESVAVRTEAAAPRRAKRRQTLRATLDTFVVGPSNALAHSTACTVARSLGEEFKPVVLHGPCGLGKTHLLQGIYNAIAKSHPTIVCRYVSGEQFTNEFVCAVKGGRIQAFRGRFRRVDVLIIDDIHFLANKKATQEEFLHTFNAIDGGGKQVVLSSDSHPRSITSLSEPLVNRLICGMVVKIGPPDFQMRREILRQKAQRMRTDIPDGVLDFVARHVTSNVRELEGCLYKLVALAALNKGLITMDLARVALDEYLIRTNRPNKAVEIERIVADHFGCTREMLHSSLRTRTVSLARGIAVYLIRKHTHMSYPEIGKLIGNKNHSTVLMATRRIEKTLNGNSAVSWTSSSGTREEPLCELLEMFELAIQKRCG